MGHSLICWQYFLRSGAIILAISGIVVVAVASYFIYELHEYAPLIPADVYGSPGVLLTVGLMICILGWYTWQFTNFASRDQVIILGVSLGIILLFEISAGIWALVRHEEIVDLSSTPQISAMYSFTNEDDQSLRLFCCDVVGPSEYDVEDSFYTSCCNISIFTNSSNIKSACNSIYAKGCFHVAINHTRSVLLHVFLLGLCSVILQVCFITCVIYYMKACLRKRRRRATISTQPSSPGINDGSNYLFRQPFHYPM